MKRNFYIYKKQYLTHYATIDFKYSEYEDRKLTFCAVRLWKPGYGDKIEDAYLSLFGLSICSPKDKYSKIRGCEIALAKATKSMPRKLRKRLWNEVLK